MIASRPIKQTLTTSRIWLLVHNKQVIFKFSIFILFHTFSRCSILCHVLNISYIWFVGMGIEPPSPYEIKNKYLEMEYKDMEAYVNQQREKWKTYGCTIMLDGWTGPMRLSIINFMVYSKGIQCSSSQLMHLTISKTINTYTSYWKNVIKEVGVDNVVQIVTDNGTTFVKAGKLLMKKFNLYWTPCAAHCIELMFEDIEKRPSIYCRGDTQCP